MHASHDLLPQHALLRGWRGVCDVEPTPLRAYLIPRMCLVLPDTLLPKYFVQGNEGREEAVQQPFSANWAIYFLVVFCPRSPSRMFGNCGDACVIALYTAGAVVQPSWWRMDEGKGRVYTWTRRWSQVEARARVGASRRDHPMTRNAESSLLDATMIIPFVIFSSWAKSNTTTVIDETVLRIACTHCKESVNVLLYLYERRVLVSRRVIPATST